MAINVNGIGATAAVGNPTGLTPGGQQAVGSDTSVPVLGANCHEDISCSLSNPDFSSGTFVLPAGTDIISGTRHGQTGALVVEAVLDLEIVRTIRGRGGRGGLGDFIQGPSDKAHLSASGP